MSSLKRRSVRVNKSAKRRSSKRANKRKTVKKGKRVKSRRKRKSAKRGGGACMSSNPKSCEPNKLSTEDIESIIDSHKTVFTNKAETAKFRILAAQLDFPRNKSIPDRTNPNDFGTSYTKYINNASPKEQMMDYLYNYGTDYYFDNTANLNRDLPIIDWEITSAFSQGLNHYNRA